MVILTKYYSSGLSNISTTSISNQKNLISEDTSWSYQGDNYRNVELADICTRHLKNWATLSISACYLSMQIMVMMETHRRSPITKANLIFLTQIYDNLALWFKPVRSQWNSYFLIWAPRRHVLMMIPWRPSQRGKILVGCLLYFVAQNV